MYLENDHTNDRNALMKTPSGIIFTTNQNRERKTSSFVAQ